ncbi:TPA: DUF1642 domain-containing protein [Streptococcus agalactiae]|nr:DUF1642 domain-containing protein [Streptococcus agalactiae]
MNIEEAKKAIRELDAFNYCDFKGNLVRKIDVLSILDQIDQPQPEVPRCVADWYEKHKDSLECDLYLYHMSIYDEEVEKDDFYYWMQTSKNPVYTLINMHQFGYTIQKEKLYTVEIPNPNGLSVFLRRLDDGNVVLSIPRGARWRGMKEVRLTESEIRKDFDWAWQFRKDVENE